MSPMDKKNKPINASQTSRQTQPGRAPCTVIIATMARHERRSSLLRAISSIRDGNQCAIEILVVVNGEQFDPELLQLLSERDDLQMIQSDQASLPAAILAGRKTVRTDYFGFLDDDDEYLAGAVDQRLAVLTEHNDAALVASNGLRASGGEESLALSQLQGADDDCLRSLFRENWLASCGGLYRTDQVPSELFEDIPKYLEWTWLAFRIASSGVRIKILDVPTFRINDTPDSESKSEAYLLSHAEILGRMRKMAARKDIAKLLARRQSAALHNVSTHYLASAAYRKAWAAHLQSLGLPGGLSYLAYSRHLLTAYFSRR